jgi:hypothetical protein
MRTLGKEILRPFADLIGATNCIISIYLREDASYERYK